MPGTPVVPESTAKRSETHAAAPRGLSLGTGILWMLAIAGGWTLVLVLFHNLMARLLS